MPNETDDKPTPANPNRVEVVLKHELARAEAAAARSRRDDPPDDEPEEPRRPRRVRIKGEGNDERVLGVEEFEKLLEEYREEGRAQVRGTPSGPDEGIYVGDERDHRRFESVQEYNARLAEERGSGRYEGAGRLLKSLGIPKRERDVILRELIDPDNDFAIKEAEGGKPKYKLTKAEELEVLAAAKAEYDGVKPKLERVSKAEARLVAMADAEYKALPPTAQKLLDKELPKDADAVTRLDAIDRYKSLLAELGGNPTAAEKREAAETAAAGAEAAAEKRAAAAEKPADKRLKPATTGAGPGPSQAEAPGSLTPYQKWRALEERSEVAAANYYRANKDKIEASRPTDARD